MNRESRAEFAEIPFMLPSKARKGELKALEVS